MKHVEDLRIGQDNFIEMEVGIRRGDDAKLDQGAVKKRVIEKKKTENPWVSTTTTSS